MSGTTLGTTDRLAAFAATTPLDALPDEVVERASLLLLDIAGIAIRARHDADSTPSLMSAVRSLGLGGGNGRVFGDNETMAPPAAALINGTLAHSLDFDDTHAEGSLHCSAPVVPAALAAAEMAGADGATTLLAVIIGWEVQTRLGMALDPRAHYDRGFHPTATCGAFGAAAAAGVIFGLDAPRMASAFGIAGSQASGSLQFLFDGAWTKRFQVGWAAQAGLVAATLARDGFKGPGQAVEGAHGFLGAYAPDANAETAVRDLGTAWETMAIGVKPYPSCRYTHSGMDALIALKEEYGLTPDDIVGVEIGLNRPGMTIVGEPEEKKQNPENAVDGQFSMAFCAAVALREGTMGWDDYARHLGNPETAALTRRVTCAFDEKVQAALPDFSAVARVETRQGRLEKFVRVPKGEPSTFPTASEFKAKFDALVAPYIGESRRERLAQRLLGFRAEASVAPMLEDSRPDPALRMAGED